LEFPVLTGLESEVSPWANPTDWLHSDTNRVNAVIEKIVTLTNSSEIEEANVSGAMIYPVSYSILMPKPVFSQCTTQHLIIYIFLHLMHCTIDKRYVSFNPAGASSNHPQFFA
jgi:hypothetical protein